VGIVASRIVERFCRPVFVLCEDEESGLAAGSGRSIRAFHLLEALESMPELFTKFGGHRQAAGLTLESGRINEFRERLNAYALDHLTEDDFRPIIEIDAFLNANEISDATVQRVHGLAPFGFGNSAPVFALRGAQLAGPPSVIKDKHLRFTIRQNGRTLTVKGWNCGERVEELNSYERFDVAIALEEDSYSAERGYAPWSAILKDFRRSSEDDTV
jgi:single-stranded-DNA-specific exonuclease